MSSFFWFCPKAYDNFCKSVNKVSFKNEGENVLNFFVCQVDKWKHWISFFFRKTLNLKKIPNNYLSRS